MKLLPGFIRHRPVLFSMMAVGVLVLVLLPASLPMVMRCLIAWCVATFLFVLVVPSQMTGHSRAERERRAAALDSSAVAILVLAGIGAAASFVAVVVVLAGMQSVPPEIRSLHLALTLATVVCSWFFVQMIFSVHYAHVFYLTVARKERPPLDFGGPDEDPDFWDFVYFTVSIGATSQTSDTNVRSKLMRRIVTAHATFAFFFNATVLALVVNIAAGLLGT